jgi:two-component system, cell cycle sensor histidine kinase and response regulator CckA
MAIRYTDFSTKNTSSDFVSRKYIPTVVQLSLVFVFVLIIGITLSVLLLDKTLLIILLTLFMGALGVYVIIQIQRSHDLVLATEFQNALFASALGFNNKFCLIIKREGSIIYMDNGFQKMFPDLSRERHLSIAIMLKLGRVSAIDREKVFDIIERGVHDRVIFDIRGSDNQVNKIVMSFEPIARPAGFILLRGREFIQQRAGQAVQPDDMATTNINPLLNKSTITIFSYIMDRMNMGIYMNDTKGNLIYANPVFENWLAFKEGEIASGSYSLKDIVHGASQADTISPGDFEGEMTLVKKEGGIIRAFINQKIIYGEDKKPLGCVALINNIVERDTESIKKLW